MRLTRMGFVFQHMNMLSNLNIIDNITFPAVRADKKHTKQHYDRAHKLLNDFHIGELADRRVIRRPAAESLHLPQHDHETGDHLCR